MKKRIQAIAARLRARPDSEHEQAIIRLSVGMVLFVYLLPAAFVHSGQERETDLLYIGAMVAFLAFAGAIIAGIFLYPGVSRTRRVLSAVVDAGAVTFFMITAGAHAAPLFLVYVWNTLANGFRFGSGYLLNSLGLSVLGFVTVLIFSPFWSAQLDIGIGFLIGMIALSLYVLTLVKRMFAAVARAEAANQAKRRFVSVVSHEMRTPLNAIVNMAELVRDTPLNREQVDMVQTLVGSSRVLLGLVEDVLDFSKIEAGKLSLEQAEFDLHALVSSTAKILNRQVEEKGLELVVSIMPQVPPALRGDPHHLRQVLINLLGNAIKFTSRGSVTVHVSMLTESESHVGLKFSVRDTGIGIPPEAQQRIFESFGQADDSTTRRFGGTGLGTTIAKQLVELMGGRMGLESAVGLGSTFWFEVEFEKLAGEPQQGDGEFSDKRILLIGFPEAEEASVSSMLSGWGARAVVSASVEDAAARTLREISTAQPLHSALVFMPTTLGAQSTLKRLRQSVHQPVLPVVAVVPAEAERSGHESLGGGRNALIEWPVDKRLLFNALHAASVEIEDRSEVVFLSEYLKRREGAANYRILVADDNAANRAVISKILERAGHSVELVDDGDQALDAAERGSYDLIVLDRNMPEVSGIEAVKALRLINAGRDRIPVIMLSADVTPEAKSEAIEAGADAFLGKPIEATRLLESIGDLCARRKPQTVQVAPLRSVRPAVIEESGVPVLNTETIGLLEELGSGSDFMEKLISAFVKDTQQVLRRLEFDPGYLPSGEFRSLVHALKGSVSSVGADRLTASCNRIGSLTDAEIRIQGAGLARSLREEFDQVRQALDEYLARSRRSAGF